MFALTLLALSAGSLVSAANFSVEVGGVGLRYTPNNTIAAIGDTVTFLFAGGAHSVTESTFEDPCALYQNASTDAIGFDSGIIPVNVTLGYPTVTYTVTSNDTIWFHCKQVGHCPAGMVGAINAPLNGTQTFAAFYALAMNATASNATTIVPLTTTALTGVGFAGGNATSTVASNTFPPPMTTAAPTAAASTTAAAIATPAVSSAVATTMGRKLLKF